MLKLIAGLSLVILLSGSLNYYLFTEAKKDAVEISNLKGSNKNLQEQIDNSKKVKTITEDTYDSVMKKVETSDKSFDQLTNKLNVIDCPKPIKNTTGGSNEPIKVESNDTDLISNYYDILHSAYNLQNTH